MSDQISIYNNLGEKVKTLVDKEFNAGQYSVNFDGNNFASGIYYYKLISGNNVETKKMILLK